MLTFLLDAGGVPEDQQDLMSGEDIAAKVAELDITKVLKAFGATKINPAVAQKAVDGAVALAG